MHNPQLLVGKQYLFTGSKCRVEGCKEHAEGENIYIQATVISMAGYPSYINVQTNEDAGMLSLLDFTEWVEI